jgi:uncharacterized protein YjbI with pentapeptide repeats
MSQCKHYDICGRDVEGDPADGLCILHSTNLAKDTHAFTEALAAHRKHKGDNFSQFVFPDTAVFSGATFSKRAYFSDATFSEAALFSRATFSGEAHVYRATFAGRTRFAGQLGGAEAAGRIFAGTEVDFRQVVIDPPDVIRVYLD